MENAIKKRLIIKVTVISTANIEKLLGKWPNCVP